MCGGGGGGGGRGGYVIANVPTHGNQFQGLECALVTKAASGEALLAPFMLTEHALVSFEIHNTYRMRFFIRRTLCGLRKFSAIGKVQSTEIC